MLQGGRDSLAQFPINPTRSRFLNPEVRKALVEDINLIDMEGFCNNLLYLIPKCSVRTLVRGIVVPTLLVAGKFDKPFSLLITQFRENIPTLKVIELDGGHAVNVDAVDRFNESVREFIAHHVEDKNMDI
jgi:pimeloyl-ACP methyl ester carboxylesterase